MCYPHVSNILLKFKLYSLNLYSTWGIKVPSISIVNGDIIKHLSTQNKQIKSPSWVITFRTSESENQKGRKTIRNNFQKYQPPVSDKS